MNESHSLLVTGTSPIPVEVKHGVIINRNDLRTTHEEADLIMVQQAYRYILDNDTKIVTVISDDTDVFVLLVYFYWKLGLKRKVFLEATGGDHTLIDIGNTSFKNMDIVPNLVAAHALSGCDTASPYVGIGKLTIVKKLRQGVILDAVGDVAADISTAIDQATLLISDCYGFKSTSMTDCRIQSWIQKTSKARKSAPPLKELPPTDEAFQENVKRAVLQSMIWYSTMNSDPPDVDPTLFGWAKDMSNKILVAVTLPDNVSPAPEAILKLMKCGCSTTSPCNTKRCSCSSANVACAIMCKCRGDAAVFHNEETKRATLAEVELVTNECDDGDDYIDEDV